MSRMESCILSLLQGCNSMARLQRIHAHVILNGYQDNPAISNKLLSFCAISVSGSLAYARLLFNQNKNPETSAWNSMIRGYSQSPFPFNAVFYYNEMMLACQSRPDTFTFSFLLKACEKSKAETKCREAHGSIIRTGYATDVVVCTNLMRSYVANGSIETARAVFGQMPERDLVSWNSMISCYSQAGLHEEALRLYSEMMISKVGIDEFTLVSLLSCCAHLGALDFGAEMHHRFVSQKRFITDNVFVGNALIDMYAKCGSLDGALHLFNGMKKRDVSTWNALIVGFGVHGLGDEAIALFRRMLIAGNGIRPNSITFLGLLCGCSHQGLVEEGVRYFDMMRFQFNLKPGIKHYGCMVDLFGRAGKLERALEIIKSSSFVEDDPIIWRTLLGSCKIHGNLEIGEVAMKNLLRLEALSAGDCVLLAGIYAEVRDQQGVSRMRKLIRSRGIKTTPGWSWIEVAGKVHRFVVGDLSHCDSVEIYTKLREITQRAILGGYVEEVQQMPDSTEWP